MSLNHISAAIITQFYTLGREELIALGLLKPADAVEDILYVYDMLFSVMLKFVNLGSQSAFASSIVPIWSAIAAENAVEGTTAMPITRDLSAGKRQTLQLWIYLIANNYQVANFNVNSIPANWTPSS